ncbi:outer membrane protein assembly factor BamD precursor [mine drainage metagenome]|uniref:Outer membrane protein assembly factor BamD n=1 Tax=mine drainage metagenome TaxID=410659 RepID=A0A1J5QAI9_9ZZZZ
MKRSLALIPILFLAGCAIFGSPDEIDETKGWSVQRLNTAAEESMRDRDYDKAIKYYQTLESRFPHGRYALQAELEVAYAYYKKGEPAAALSAADRFIKLHPHHPNVDYVYYLKGLATFSDRGLVDKLTRQDLSDRDPKAMHESFLAFKELLTRYPDSKYAKDAALRMSYLVNTLAEHEVHVARYYMKRQAYIAALNRCKYVIENYPATPSVEEALVIMVSAYDLLGMEDLKQDTLRVLKTNYPQSRFNSTAVPEDKKLWWKFWDSLW